jgi:hypothetical protein
MSFRVLRIQHFPRRFFILEEPCFLDHHPHFGGDVCVAVDGEFTGVPLGQIAVAAGCGAPEIYRLGFGFRGGSEGYGGHWHRDSGIWWGVRELEIGFMEKIGMQCKEYRVAVRM